MESNVHLHFNGDCEEAFKTYAKILGGKTTFSMTWGESPAAKTVPANWKSKLIHASFEAPGLKVSGDDAPPEYQAKGQGYEIHLSIKNIVEGERIFKALAEKGQIRMPFAETFWAQRFGMVTDRFGTPWMINCPKPE